MKSAMDDLFPPPIAISGKYLWTRSLGGAAAMLGGAVVAALFIGWQVGDLQQLQRDTELYESAAAVPAEDVEVEGDVTTHILILAEYKLNVAYTDKDGKRHASKVEFDTVPELDHTSVRAVHYDPADPTRFALNWAVRERGKRLGAILFLMLTGGLLIGGSLGFLGWAALRNAMAFRRISRNGKVVLCAPVKVTEQRQYGKVVSTTYRFRVPAGPRPEPFERQQAFRPRTGGPLVVKEQLVGMYSPDAPRAVYLLTADFEPLVLSPEEKAQARRRLES